MHSIYGSSSGFSPLFSLYFLGSSTVLEHVSIPPLPRDPPLLAVAIDLESRKEQA
jgi:hypothetical protein